MKKVVTMMLAVIFLVSIPTSALGAETKTFPDVPSNSWALESIEKAYNYGLMNGTGNGFGYGKTITRAEFVTVLVRMMGWETEKYTGDTYPFTDIKGNWAVDYIIAAANNGAINSGGAFRPGDVITRREMAVMLVSALGYSDIAKKAENYDIPFTDVTEDRGYIVVAYDIGLTNGVTSTAFAPEGTATREQAATMLVRIYEKITANTQWKHAFYAISSYSQLELAKNFDAVSLGWSSMALSDSGNVYLDTTKTGSTYYIPGGYEEVVKTLRDYGTHIHLSVYMDMTGKIGNESKLSILLKDPAKRTDAVNAIMDEVTKTYSQLGYNPYQGVTIDFEGLRSNLKSDFTAFLTELQEKLTEKNMTLYVTVMPATEDGAYYDGYDYAAIGEIADKVILMAHDYSTKNLTGFLNSTYYKTAALTPISSVYYSLRTLCASIQDKSKAALAVSLTSSAWRTDSNGLLINEIPLSPSYKTIYDRINSGATKGWSETYKNPYLTYTTENGENIFLWYEDEESISEKVTLAKLFGLDSVSVWRLGLIANYDGLNVLNGIG